jgi:NAD(P)-dependent dehydrogenase (short-subunit alcohol dehydrogenase family)
MGLTTVRPSIFSPFNAVHGAPKGHQFARGACALLFIWDKVKEQQLIHRPAEPRDLVGALSFLCSDDAAFVTGQTYHVDGGAVL